MGDSYQDLLALNYCLMALSPVTTITSVELESDSSGSLDDVVVRHRDPTPDLFIQAKLNVTPGKCDLDWLMEPVGSKGLSLLQKMHT